MHEEKLQNSLLAQGCYPLRATITAAQSLSNLPGCPVNRQEDVLLALGSRACGSLEKLLGFGKPRRSGIHTPCGKHCEKLIIILNWSRSSQLIIPTQPAFLQGNLCFRVAWRKEKGDQVLGGVSGSIYPDADGKHSTWAVFSGISVNFQENPLIFVSPVYNLFFCLF